MAESMKQWRVILMTAARHCMSSLLVAVLGWVSVGCGTAAPSPVAGPRPKAGLLPGCGAYQDSVWRLVTVESMLQASMGSAPPLAAVAPGADPSSLPIRPHRLHRRAELLDQWASEANQSSAVETPWGTSSVNLAEKLAALASGARALADALEKNDAQAAEAARASLDVELKELRTLASSARNRCFSLSKESTSRGLSPGEIQGTVLAIHPALGRCYDAGLLRNPELAGIVVIRFIIQQDGSVPLVVLDDTSLPDPNVIECMVPEFARLVFPAPVGSFVTVVYPVDFSPTAPPASQRKE
jgi:hypothetical protein